MANPGSEKLKEVPRQEDDLLIPPSQRSNIMRIVGAVLSIGSALAIIVYLSYLFWTEVIMDPEAALVLKIAIPLGVAGLVILMTSVLKERLRNRGTEGLNEVKP